jgi:triacylglycerol lipase
MQGTAQTTPRHIFLIPGFFGFANLGDFSYWGPVYRKLSELLEETGMPARIHCVKSLPTASLRTRTRCLLETVAAARPARNAVIHLIGHSTGGLDARLFLTPAVDLNTRIDVESYATRVRSAVSVATPHGGAPIASFFTGLLGRNLLQVLSIMTMAALRGSELPLSVWTRVAGLFALPAAVGGATGTLAGQLYRELLADFNPARQAQVSELLAEVGRDQALLTQLTVETMDLFNAAAGDRDTVSYGSVVTMAQRPGLETSLEIGLDAGGQAQQAFYYSLSRLATGYEFSQPGGEFKRALRQAFGEFPDSDANDGIVPTLSQPWGRCVALARADHLDIIGHHGDDDSDEPHFDWLATRSNFRSSGFHDVWQRVVDFLAEAEGLR